MYLAGLYIITICFLFDWLFVIILSNLNLLKKKVKGEFTGGATSSYEAL